MKKEMKKWGVSIFVAPGKRKDSSNIAEMAEDAGGALFVDPYVLLWVADGASTPILEALEKLDDNKIGLAPRIAARCMGRIFEKYALESLSRKGLKGITGDSLRDALSEGLKSEMGQRVEQLSAFLSQYWEDLPKVQEENGDMVGLLQWNVAFICGVVDVRTWKGFLWWAGDGLVVIEKKGEDKLDVWEPENSTGVFLKAKIRQGGEVSNWESPIGFRTRELDLVDFEALMLMSDGVSRRRQDIEALYTANPDCPLSVSITQEFNRANRDDDKSLVILKII